MAKNVNIKKVSPETKQLIINDYQNNVSLRQLEQKYKVTRQSISAFLTEQGIKITVGNHYRKYFHDEDYFENIDTPEKAYWLGFMFSDGYIVDKTGHGIYGQDCFGLNVQEQDKDVLEKFKQALHATNPITWEVRAGRAKMGRLLCTSQKTVNDLIDKGCTKQKSLTLQPPEKLSDSLKWHFIRGFLDGDGSIIKCHPKNSNHFVYQVSFVGTYEMMIWLQEQFDWIGSVLPEKRRTNTWYFNFGGNIQVLRYLSKVYNEATVYMDRKYKRFQELLELYKI